MNKADIKLAKEKILKCLTEDFEYGPPRKRKQNLSIFDPVEGWQNYSGTDLQMVMDKVVLGLYFAMEDSKGD